MSLSRLRHLWATLCIGIIGITDTDLTRKRGLGHQQTSSKFFLTEESLFGLVHLTADHLHSSFKSLHLSTLKLYMPTHSAFIHSCRKVLLLVWRFCHISDWLLIYDDRSQRLKKTSSLMLLCWRNETKDKTVSGKRESYSESHPIEEINRRRRKINIHSSHCIIITESLSQKKITLSDQIQSLETQETWRCFGRKDTFLSVITITLPTMWLTSRDT